MANYKVEYIIDYKVENKKKFFLIKWLNFDDSYNSWELRSNLRSLDHYDFNFHYKNKNDNIYKKKHRRKLDGMSAYKIKKKYKCSHCLKSFCKKYILTDHIKQHCSEDFTQRNIQCETFDCDICDSKYITKKSLFIHKKSH